MKNTIFQKSLLIASLFLLFLSVKTNAQESSISDHIAILNELTGGKISAGDFKKATGLDLKTTDSSENCEVAEFHIVWVEKGQDPVEAIVRSANYNQKALNLVKKAKSGTIYYFDAVKIKCEGNEELESVNSLVFKIE